MAEEIIRTVPFSTFLFLRPRFVFKMGIDAGGVWGKKPLDIWPDIGIINRFIV